MLEQIKIDSPAPDAEDKNIQIYTVDADEPVSGKALVVNGLYIILDSVDGSQWTMIPWDRIKKVIVDVPND